MDGGKSPVCIDSYSYFGHLTDFLGQNIKYKFYSSFSHVKIGFFTVKHDNELSVFGIWMKKQDMQRLQFIKKS